MKTKRFAFLAILLLPLACATNPIVQLAQRCDELATAINIAAVHRAQGKLTAGQINAIVVLEPVAKTMCDKANPPANVETALARVVAIAEQITLINAGVR